jgi:uncharacterized membrane protein (DUF2068 family)
MADSARPLPELPGTTRPRRFRPKFHYELIVCGFRGHELVGTDAAEVRPEDALVARETGGLRWYRCLRCDSWLPLEPPPHPHVEHPPDRDRIEVPLRGRALRDKVVLRLIAVDRALHFLVLGIIAVAVLVFAAKHTALKGRAFRVFSDLQGGLGGPARDNQHGVIHELRHLFSIQTGTLTKIGLIVAAYALLEGAEAFGLWWQKRWAEYLTFIATALLLPLEIYELTHTLSPLKILTLVINLAVEAAERDRDSGWPALERATPGGSTLPA